MINVKLILSYEGTAFFGWQKTKFGPSIEEALENAISKILKGPIALQAASRTDAGVHAEGQVVNFFTQKTDLFKLKRAIQAHLPKTISILSMEEAPINFHPTLHALAKEYHYYVCLGPVQLPFFRNSSWHVPYLPSIEIMQEASLQLLGTHDFSAFCNDRSLSEQDPIKTLYKIQLEALPHQRLKISIVGNHFLYKMVRNIVGTLVYIGCGKIPSSSLSSILQSLDRKKAGPTAPAHGLTLHHVRYNLSGSGGSYDLTK